MAINWKKEREYKERIKQIETDFFKKPAITVPPAYARWNGEMVGQLLTTIAYETDDDNRNGTMSLIEKIHVVAREDGVVFSGYDSIHWNWAYNPLDGEIAEADGKDWQVLVDSTGRDLWIEVSEYATLVNRARLANQEKAHVN